MALFPDEGRKNELTEVAGVGGSRLYVRLYTNFPPVDHTLTLASLIEASHDGYVPYQSSLWSPPAIDTNGDAFILSPVIVFVGPTAPPPGVITGFYVTIGDGPSAKLWFAEAFLTPITLALPTQQIPLQVQARLRYLAA